MYMHSISHMRPITQTLLGITTNQRRKRLSSAIILSSPPSCCRCRTPIARRLFKPSPHPRIIIVSHLFSQHPTPTSTKLYIIGTITQRQQLIQDSPASIPHSPLAPCITSEASLPASLLQPRTKRALCMNPGIVLTRAQGRRPSNNIGLAIP